METEITDAENENCQQLHDEMLSWLDVQDEYDVTLVNDTVILYFALKTIRHPATELVGSISQSILKLCTMNEENEVKMKKKGLRGRGERREKKMKHKKGKTIVVLSPFPRFHSTRWVLLWG